MPGPPLERIEAARLAAAQPSRRPTPDARLVALGWATVDLERALAALTTALGVPDDAFVEASESVTLGARCLRGGGGTARRRGPGHPRTVDRGAPGDDPGAARRRPHDRLVRGPGRRHAGAGPARPGPFGPERLVGGDPIHGPHRFLIEGAPGTIAP